MAQGFSKKYIETRPVMLYSSVLMKDSCFYTIGVTAQSQSPYLPKGLFGKHDLDGNLKNYHALFDGDTFGYGLWVNTYATVDDTTLKLFGYIDDQQTRAVLFTIDYNANIKKVSIYNDTTSIFFRGDVITKDNSGNYYLACNYQAQGQLADGYIIKVGKTDAVIWKKRYGTNSRMEFINSMCVLPNNHVLIGSFRTTDPNFEPVKVNTWIYEIDTVGNVVRQWFDPNDSTIFAGGLKQTKDNGFIYGSGKLHLYFPGNFYTWGTIVKLNASLNKEWSFIGGGPSLDTRINDVEEMPNGDILGCGSTYYYYSDSSVISGWVVRLSSAGDVIWDRNFEAATTRESYNFLNDIDILPDGSIIATGYVNIGQATQQGQQAWLLKLDSNGCVIENCIIGIDEAANEESITIYPNPANNQLNISLNTILKNQSVQIVSPDGRVVMQQQVFNQGNFSIDVSVLPAGLYYIALQDKEKRAVKRFVKQ